MDILEARKKAKQQQEKASVRVETSTAVDQKVEKEKEPSTFRDIPLSATAEEQLELSEKPSPAKEKRKKTAKEKPSEKDSAQKKKTTRPEEIPVGAKAPEELELAPHEFHELPGTQEMPELPDIPEEELGGQVSLGDVPPAKMAEEAEEPYKVPAKEISEATRNKLAHPSKDEKKAIEGEQEHIADLELAMITRGGEFEEEAEKKDEPAVEMPREYLSFMLGREEYAIPLQRISEIIKPRPITEVPRLPEFVLGILTLRGVVIPVFDLSMKLSLGGVVPSKRNRIIIVNQNGERVGLLVDNVKDVVRILPSDIEPPPPVMSGVDTQYIEGVGRAMDSDGLKQVLEKEKDEEEKKTEMTKKKKMFILLNLERVVEL